MMESIVKAREAIRKDSFTNANLSEAFGTGCSSEYANTLEGVFNAIEAEIAEKYMELPLDADGVPIHLGDVMDGVGMYDTLRDVTGEVIEVSFNATDDNESVESVALQVWSKDGKSWHRVYIDQYADPYRHHAKPRTLEDVLQCAGVSIAAIEDVAADIRELLGVEQ